MATTADLLLERLTAEPEQAGLFLDFDGVLAPIVARPEDATAPPETRAELARLAGRYRLVCIVSGRPSTDIRDRVGPAGVVIVGTHGLELHPEAEKWRAIMREVAADAPWPPEQTEDKGLSVTFHYRDHSNELQALRDLKLMAAQLEEAGFVTRFGRKVLEVMPPIDANKGTAVRQLLAEAGLTRALVAGDDTTDLDAFRAVDDLELRVRVAVASAESPRALRDAADIVVDSTDAFLELLRTL
jgi:trehalose 6-phosphate phosphatase